MNWIKNIFKKKEIITESNPYTIQIPDCEGNRYVIPDIHGCLTTFKALVEKINITKNDQLFLLGDYIDRGKNSKGVIDYIIDLQDISNVYSLRGNHEDDLLIRYKYKHSQLVKNYIEKEKYPTLFQSDNEIEQKYLEFIRKLSYFIELENEILVHGGFNFSEENPFSNTTDMLWIRYFDYDFKLAKGKKIIHGHTPFTLEEISLAMKNNENIIPLDNGCVYDNEEGFGDLLCLNITTFELFFQKNIE